MSGALPDFAASCRNGLREGREALHQAYLQGAPGPRLVHGQCGLVDRLLREIWKEFPRHAGLPCPRDLALVAVGGYGRGELFPYSDIDLLFLHAEGTSPDDQKYIEGLVTFLWDIRMEVGHSVRDARQCADLGREDLSIATSLMEARFLAGDRHLYEQLRDCLNAREGWTEAAFFAAKLAEQERRHMRSADGAYGLEPNLKEGPGGLRDLQMLGWLAANSLHSSHPKAFLDAGLLGMGEIAALARARNFLWRLRAGLHYTAGRREERLRLDYQRSLATDFGYRDGAQGLAVERLMQRYYRHCHEVSRLTGIVLESLAERLQKHPPAIRPVHPDFVERFGNLEAADPDLFIRRPQAILTLFRLLAERETKPAIGPGTQRLLGAAASALRGPIRADPAMAADFLAILDRPSQAPAVLELMHHCGVLEHYVPAFARITGRMQHDPFHVHTVDRHTLVLLRELGEFWTGAGGRDLAVQADARKGIDRPALLFLAGLFHDIAKGRGGDHSDLGAREARRFCRRLGLSSGDVSLVAWLVRHHLAMSTVSQRRDLSDPLVIRDFARLVGNDRRLHYLLLLTTADMRATNPDLWTDWKARLLSELYRATSGRLRRGLQEALDGRVIAHDKERDLLPQLPPEDRPAARRLWQKLGVGYLLRYENPEILWHARAILAHRETGPLVVGRRHDEAASEILVYTPDGEGLFSRITGALDRQRLNILDARIDTSADGFALDTFTVLDDSHAFAASDAALNDLAAGLRTALAAPPRMAPAYHLRHPGSRQRFFASLPVQVSTDNDSIARYTVLEVVAPDRLGLLYRVGQALQELGLSIHGAKLSTFGERVEDTFFILRRDGKKVPEDELCRLRSRILVALSSPDISPDRSQNGGKVA